jgi:hypothetical protein
MYCEGLGNSWIELLVFKCIVRVLGTPPTELIVFECIVRVLGTPGQNY